MRRKISMGCKSVSGGAGGGCVSYVLGRLESRVYTRRNHSRARHNLPGQVPVRRKQHVPRQLSHGNHIWRLLKLQSLMVRECGLGVDNNKWIHRAILLLILQLWRVANPRKASIRAATDTAETSRRVNDLRGTTGTALEV